MENILSSFFRLNRRDFINGLVMAVISGVGGVIVQAAQAGTFDLFTYDWMSIGKLALNVSVAYLFKNLLTTGDGKFLGAVNVK